MWSLIQRNEASRSWLKLAITAISTSTLLLAIHTYHLARGQQGIMDSALLVLWFNAAIFLLFPQTGRRCSEFDLALPFPAERLWRAHLASVLLASFIILGVGLVLLLGVGTLLAILRERYAHAQPELDRLIPATVSCLALAVVMYSALQPHLHRIPSDRGMVLSKIGIIAVGAGLTWILGQLPWYASLMPLVAAAVIGLQVQRGLPPTLSLLPSIPQHDNGGPAGGVNAHVLDTTAWGSGHSAKFRLHLVATILRALSKGPAAYLLALPLAFCFGGLLAGFGEVRWFDEELRFSLVPLTSYILLSFSGTPLGKFAVLDYLPIPRRTVFAALMLPQILAVISGYGVGLILVANETRMAPPILCHDEEGQCHIQVPLSYFEVAWDGEPPVIEAPWGETVEPTTRPIWRNGRAVLYQPYTTTAESSPKFIAWQISRAVAAIYDEQIDLAEIQQRYLVNDFEGPPIVSDNERALLTDHPDWRPRFDGPVFPVLMLLVGLIFYPALGIYLGQFRAGISDAARKRTFWILMILLLAIHMSQYVLAATKIVHLDSVTALWHLLIRQFASIGGVISVYVIAVAVLGWGYRALLRKFEKIEAVTSCDVCL
jgi:hypothetical protein